MSITDINHLRQTQKPAMRRADAAGAAGQKSASAFFMRLAIQRELRKRDLQAARKPWPGATVRRADAELERCSLRIGSASAMPEGAVVGTQLDWTPPEPPAE
jgi:hypothetical protein